MEQVSKRTGEQPRRDTRALVHNKGAYRVPLLRRSSAGNAVNSLLLRSSGTRCDKGGGQRRR